MWIGETSNSRFIARAGIDTLSIIDACYTLSTLPDPGVASALLSIKPVGWQAWPGLRGPSPLSSDGAPMTRLSN